ncbi:11114_t:CDS:2 [Funneliformis geosporum]|uniref:11114_t:CDS:1 n=1 Tax=Funneliformis geosporum TaxID=1117311 RepID=A0A9W4SQA3_9GLOM|nr:11114_t:CDS:2 [Funneliformis geosporum]
MSSPKKRMNLDVYNIIEIKDWSYDNLVERYRANLERKDLSHVLDNIKKDLVVVATSESGFDEERKKKGSGNYRPLETQAVTLSPSDEPLGWKTISEERKMNLKRDFSHFTIDSLRVNHQMISTGSNAIQISDNRKHLRNNNGEAVNISDETNIVCGRAFLRLAEEKLTRKPGLYELKPSPAESIMELVE